MRIGLSLLVDPRRVSDVLQPYLAEHPGVETFFKECYLGDLEQRLHDGQLDIVIRPRAGSGPVPKSVVRTSFYEEDLFYLARQTGNAAAGEGAVWLKDIAGEVFVLGPDGCGLAAMTRNLFEKAGATLKEYTGQALSYQVMLDWADIGIGATILPESKITSPFREKARRLMLTPKKPARASFEALWMRDTAYPRHVIDMHRHFLDRVPLLLGGAAPRQLPGGGQSQMRRPSWTRTNTPVRKSDLELGDDGRLALGIEEMQAAGLHRQAHLIASRDLGLGRNTGHRDARLADPRLQQDLRAELLHHLDLGGEAAAHGAVAAQGQVFGAFRPMIAGRPCQASSSPAPAARG